MKVVALIQLQTSSNAYIYFHTDEEQTKNEATGTDIDYLGCHLSTTQ